MPLVERDSTLDSIHQLLDGAAAGRGGALFVIGEAGLGKTSLLDLAVEAARGGIAERRGELDQAEHHYLAAVALLSAMQLPLVRAETLIEFGEFLILRGDLNRARQVLGDAVHIAEQHGAEWHAARARTAWRRAGGRARRTAPGDLSPQEAAVSALVRAGRTNRQIARQLSLSENTVETHLAHVYRKLGIRRRWELIARANA